MELENQFLRATEFIAKNKEWKVSQENQLQFYGLFKQAKVGPCSIPRPGLFSFTERAKWDSWKSFEKYSKEESMKEYIQLLSKLTPNWDSIPLSINENNSSIEKEEEESKESHNFFGGPVFSVPIHDHIEISEDKKDLIYWVSLGDKEKVLESISKISDEDQKLQLINQRDESGVAALHYAVDRGHRDIVQMLIHLGADVNLQDGEGQTPLHYASIVENKDLFGLLLDNKADPTIPDEQGDSPIPPSH